MIAHQIMAELENDFKGFQRKLCTALIKLMQRLKNRQKPQNKTNFEKSKQIKT